MRLRRLSLMELRGTGGVHPRDEPWLPTAAGCRTGYFNRGEAHHGYEQDFARAGCVGDSDFRVQTRRRDEPDSGRAEELKM